MDSACISLPSPFSKCIGASEKRCLLAGHQALLKGNHPMRHYQLNHYLISPKCSGRAGQKQQVEQRGTLSSAPIYLSLTPTNYLYLPGHWYTSVASNFILFLSLSKSLYYQYCTAVLLCDSLYSCSTRTPTSCRTSEPVYSWCVLQIPVQITISLSPLICNVLLVLEPPYSTTAPNDSLARGQSIVAQSECLSKI